MNSGWLNLWHPVTNVGNEKKEKIIENVLPIPLPPPPPAGAAELNVEGKRKAEQVLDLPPEEKSIPKRGRKKKQK
jgi:hypothetical protein